MFNHPSPTSCESISPRIDLLYVLHRAGVTESELYDVLRGRIVSEVREASYARLATDLREAVRAAGVTDSDLPKVLQNAGFEEDENLEHAFSFCGQYGYNVGSQYAYHLEEAFSEVGVSEAELRGLLRIADKVNVAATDTSHAIGEPKELRNKLHAAVRAVRLNKVDLQFELTEAELEASVPF